MLYKCEGTASLELECKEENDRRMGESPQSGRRSQSAYELVKIGRNITPGECTYRHKICQVEMKHFRVEQRDQEKYSHSGVLQFSPSPPTQKSQILVAHSFCLEKASSPYRNHRPPQLIRPSPGFCLLNSNKGKVSVSQNRPCGSFNNGPSKKSTP